MAFGIIDTSILTAIADTIRTKLGVQTTYRPSEMAAAIASITSGGITPTGTKSISANGTGINVAQYAYVDVAVPTSGGISGVTDITLDIESATSRSIELDAVFSPYVDSGENCIFVRLDSLTGTGNMLALPYINGVIGNMVYRYNSGTLATVATGSGNYNVVVSPGDRFVKVTLTGGST